MGKWSPEKKERCLGISGAILLVVGCVIGGCWLYIYDAIVRWQLVLSPSSTSFDIWEDIPIPIYMEFTLFNVTNSEEVSDDPNTLPEVVEMGPYVFREYHTRVNLTWNDNNETITYRQIRRYEFQPDLSDGNLDDLVTTYNIITATTAYGVRFLPKILRMFISRLIDKTNATLLVTATVGDILFDGYDDALLDIATQLNSSLFAIPFTRFAYFAERNNSYEYDGYFTMYTGKDDLRKLGMHTAWNFERYTPYYGYPCNEVHGSSGDIWPLIEDYADVAIFVPDLCKVVEMSYYKDTEASGIEGLEYRATNRSFDNGELYPETSCNCLGECVPRGAINVSMCKWNAPLTLSLPHFYMADPSYLDMSRGLLPMDEKHRAEFALNPASGIPLYANARFQLNLMLDKYPNIRMYKTLKQRSWVPMVWFNQRVEMTDDLAPMVKLLLMAPQLGAGIFFGIAAIGALLLLAAVAMNLRDGWGTGRADVVPLLKSSEEDPAAQASPVAAANN